MTSLEILIKCGYSIQEAERISGMKYDYAKARRDQSSANEAKYGSMVSSEDGKERGTVASVYNQLRAGFDNGNCKSRRETYKRFKRLEKK